MTSKYLNFKIKMLIVYYFICIFICFIIGICTDFENSVIDNYYSYVTYFLHNMFLFFYIYIILSLINLKYNFLIIGKFFLSFSAILSIFISSSQFYCVFILFKSYGAFFFFGYSFARFFGTQNVALSMGIEFIIFIIGLLVLTRIKNDSSDILFHKLPDKAANQSSNENIETNEKVIDSFDGDNMIVSDSN